MTVDDQRNLEEELARARAEIVRVRGELDRLRARRIVRYALKLASYAKPVYKLVRGTRRPAAKAAPTRPEVVPTVLDRGVVERRADIVVCVHNAPDDVDRCLASILRWTDLSRHRLVIVDDGSDAPTADAMVAFAGEHGVDLVRHDEARGYTVAASAGIAQGDAPFAVLLNSDTIVTEGWLDRMLEVVAEDNRVAVVGPWSNAASWQSVPELTDEHGAWKVNELVGDETPDDVAAMVATGSPLRPEIALVNGFCYLLRRSAFDHVGGLDTERFPRGYGEEDDLSLRLRAAGYRLRVADDVYVHHAKSKSFTPEGRARIVETSKQVLRDKHGTDVVRAAVTNLQTELGLTRARTSASLRILRGRERQEPPTESLSHAPRIAWLQPHLEQVGGIRRTIMMTNRMRAWGAETAIVTPEGRPSTWLPIHSDVLSVHEAASRDFDVLIVTDPDVVDHAARLSAGRHITYHLAAYMRYREVDAGLRAFYDLPGLHLANSQWTADAVEEYTGRPVAGIVPGAVDPDVFHPVRTKVTHDVVCYGSHRAHKGTATIVEATRGKSLLKLVDLGLPQGSLATGICSGRVFASGAWHEGFNLPPLEAMACGVPVVMTDDGGSRDYAVDGANALVVDVKDGRAMRRAIDRLLDDHALRTSLVDAGLRTAHRFHWDAVTRTFVDLAMVAPDQP